MKKAAARSCFLICLAVLAGCNGGGGDDTSPTVSFESGASSGAESTTPVLLRVSLSESPSAAVSVNYAVTGGTAAGGGVDYTLADGVLNFAPGDRAEDIYITVADDAVEEAAETIEVTLSGPTNAVLGTTSTHTCTILDNDGEPGWKPLRIGAGGYVTGLDVASDGTKVVRTDTYGAYLWDSIQWKQLITSNSMPADDVTVERSAGVYEIRIAPSDSSIFYMSYRGYVYRSNDLGLSWTRTDFAPVAMDANDDYRTWNQKMAIDPVDPDVIYVGTPSNGLFVTDDGGTSWQPVAAVPVSTDPAGITGIVFDPGSGITGGKTNTIYAASDGNGVYRSTDAGTSWSALAGGPDSAKNARISSDGNYYVVSGSGALSEILYRWNGTAWVNITPAANNQSYDVILVDPSDPARVVAIREGGYFNQSRDRGASWDGIIWGPGYAYRQATDIPWLAWTEESYMSVGDMAFDPAVPDKIWFAQGIGVWHTSFPVTGVNSVTWTSQSAGIEQLVANDIVAPPGGKPVVAAWDRPVFYVADPDVFPSQHGVNNDHAIIMGWSVDYASSDPSFLVALVNWWGVEQDAYSTDGGQTWTIFPSFPGWNPGDWPIGGSIAASTPDNIVWVPANRKGPYYTKDRGVTWQKVVLPGVPDTQAGWDELHFAYYLNRHIIAADRVLPNTFYLYHAGYGLFRSDDSGDTWSQVYAGEISSGSGFNAKLETVPGYAGHLFFTSGHQSGQDPSGAFRRSIDGGATWSVVPDVLEAYSFGFGIEAPGSSYPAIYIAGWVNDVWGIWRSDDEGLNWTQTGEWPLGSLDHIKTVEGDKNTYGVVYVGFSGSGYAYFDMD
jgi:hypothetical protein